LSRCNAIKKSFLFKVEEEIFLFVDAEVLLLLNLPKARATSKVLFMD
jgi:hypothetical protein